MGFQAACAELISLDDDGHTRDAGLFRVSDGERLNVVSAAAEKHRHAGEYARLVFYVNDESIQHEFVVLLFCYSSDPVSNIGEGLRIMACKSAPAGTIG